MNRDTARWIMLGTGALALVVTRVALGVIAPEAYATALFLALVVVGAVAWRAGKVSATTAWQEELRELDEAREEASWDRPSLTGWVHQCHAASVRGGWWHDVKTQAPLVRNRGELLMLIVSEVAEAMEGERKDLMDDKLPHRKMAEVELADAFIRIADYAGGFGYDLEGAVREKMAYNAQRADHKPENRVLAGGKKF